MMLVLRAEPTGKWLRVKIMRNICGATNPFYWFGRGSFKEEEGPHEKLKCAYGRAVTSKIPRGGEGRHLASDRRPAPRRGLLLYLTFGGKYVRFDLNEP